MADEIISRKDAKAQGIRRYFTGKTCPHGHVSQRDTKTAACLTCRDNKNALFRMVHAEQRRAESAEYRKKNPDQRRKYYLRNREKQIVDAKAWRDAHPEQVRATAKAYYDKSAAKRAKRYEENKVALLAAGAEWKRNNKAARKKHKADRRARERAATGSWSPEDIAFLFNIQKGRCAHAWCRTPLGEKYQIDHIIALSKGGSNDRRNLQLLCRPCNTKKAAKHPVDFAQQNGLLL